MSSLSVVPPVETMHCTFMCFPIYVKQGVVRLFWERMMGVSNFK